MSFRAADDIDALLAAPKTVVGRPRWELDGRGTVATLTTTLAEDGIVIGSVFLRLSATVHIALQRGSAALVCNNRPVQRMNVKPEHPHLNPLRRPVPRSLRGLRLPEGRSRIYRWAANRIWPRPTGDNLAAGEVIEPEPGDILAALTFFLEECGIIGELPPPPWEPRLFP